MCCQGLFRAETRRKVQPFWCMFPDCDVHSSAFSRAVAVSAVAAAGMLQAVLCACVLAMALVPVRAVSRGQIAWCTDVTTDTE